MPPKEPIFGANAKPFFVQFAVGTVVVVLAAYFLGDWLYNLPCYVIECS